MGNRVYLQVLMTVVTLKLVDLKSQNERKQ